jgi:GNAT superfamily N-acetyltransferase
LVKVRTTMTDILIRHLQMPQDAERLLEMWRASDAQWPASRTRGIPMTAADMVASEEEMRKVVYVAEVDGHIAGYCSFMEGLFGRAGEGYLATLNVRPEYQKLSIARRLILATVERSVELGWQRQTLGTWSANFKAMPLYKKTGHYWTPDTAVHMQSFIPGALQLSVARPFFARHDWYQCYVRELTQEEDDQRWEGIPVFVQRWEAEGESLTIWIDREARGPLAVDTSALFVAAIPENPEPLAGSQVTMRWRLSNKGVQPMRVSLQAQGAKGLQIEHEHEFTLAAGQSLEHVAPVQVTDDAPHALDDGAAPAIRSVLHLDGLQVELVSGLRPRQPMALDTQPAYISLRPGVAQTILLQLHSALDEDTNVALALAAPEGLEVDWSERKEQIPAQGHRSILLNVTADIARVYELPVTASYAYQGSAKRSNKTLTLFCVGDGDIVTRRDDDAARLETDDLRVRVQAREGLVHIEEKSSGLRMITLQTMVGPPFTPSDFLGVRFHMEVVETGSRALVRMSAESRHTQGLWLHQEITLAANGLAACRYHLENRGDAPYRGRFRLRPSSSDRQRERMTLPLTLGLISSLASDYPNAWKDAPRDPAAYAEPWYAWERDGVAAGIAWDTHTARIDNQWWASLDSHEWALEPGQRSPDMRFAVCVGRGDWSYIRQGLLRWAGTNAATDLIPRPPALARIEPKVLATVGSHLSAALIVDTASARPTSGGVRIDAQAGLSAEPAQLAVQDLRRSTPLRQPLSLRLTPDAPLGVYRGQVELALPLSHAKQSFYVLRLGNATPVRVASGRREGQEVWSIDNGVSRWVVAPGFGPSVIAWYEQGVNQLATCFPNPQGFSWTYPWFGGIKPTLLPAGSMAYPGALHREAFAAQSIEVADAQGLPWQGVRLSAHPKKRELSDLRVELDFLTLGDSRVLKYVYRLHNLRDARQTMRVCSAVMAALGGSPTDLILHGECLQHQPNPWFTLADGQAWGALSHKDTGKTLLMVGRQPDISLQDWGLYGNTLGAGSEVELAANETVEHVYYLVLADSLEQALSYLALGEYCG